jgi:hypothetical protein
MKLYVRVQFKTIYQPCNAWLILARFSGRPQSSLNRCQFFSACKELNLSRRQNISKGYALANDQ